MTSQRENSLGALAKVRGSSKVPTPGINVVNVIEISAG